MEKPCGAPWGMVAKVGKVWHAQRQKWSFSAMDVKRPNTTSFPSAGKPKTLHSQPFQTLRKGHLWNRKREVIKDPRKVTTNVAEPSMDGMYAWMGCMPWMDKGMPGLATAAVLSRTRLCSSLTPPPQARQRGRRICVSIMRLKRRYEKLECVIY